MGSHDYIAFIFAGLFGSHIHAAPTRPNIVFIITDDLGALRIMDGKASLLVKGNGNDPIAQPAIFVGDEGSGFGSMGDRSEGQADERENKRQFHWCNR